MNPVLRFWKETRRVKRLLLPREYRRWRTLVIRGIPSILACRSLGVIDDKMGNDLEFLGPDGRWLRTKGASFGVVREIFGQYCYSSPEVLRNARNILDLGGNAGVFTLFALSCAPKALVRTVEAQPKFIPVIEANVARNGFAQRSTVENSIVGGASSEWVRALRRQYPRVGDFSIERYIDEVGECDLLKCDVEGAEFELYKGDLSWLDRVRRISLEYHGDWAAGAGLRERISAAGFLTRQTVHGSLGYVFAEQKA